MNYNSPLMKILETIANMLIVSFFFLLCSIPILTIIPSSVALYYTTNKVIFNGNGKGVTKNFFNSFKDNFIIGIKINIICLFATFFVFVGLYAGIQIYSWNIFGFLYLILGIIITFVYLITLIYIPAVISRFYLNVKDTIRLSVFFALQNILISILNVFLLIILLLIVYLIPLTLLIVPALYVDLIRLSIEKKMHIFIEVNNLQDKSRNDEINIIHSNKESLSDINNRLSRKKTKND